MNGRNALHLDINRALQGISIAATVAFACVPPGAVTAAEAAPQAPYEQIIQQQAVAAKWMDVDRKRSFEIAEADMRAHAPTLKAEMRKASGDGGFVHIASYRPAPQPAHITVHYG